MVFPASVATVTLSGTYLRSSGAGPAAGTIRIAPSVPVLADGTDLVLVPSAPLVVTLDPSGSFTATLMATDDPRLSPAGWAYVITERLSGIPDRTYLVQLPAAGGAYDLSSLAHVSPAPAVTGTVLVSQLGVPGGVATLDLAGHVTTAQLGLANTVASGTAFGAAGDPGVSSSPSRSDHQHGTPSLGAVTAGTTFGLAAANGTAGTASRSDHQHGTPALPQVGTLATDLGFSAWAYEPDDGSGGTAPATGVLQVIRLVLRTAQTISRLHFITSSAGVVATTIGGVLADAALAPVSSGFGVPATWNTAGLQTITLAAPQAMPAGPLYACVWSDTAGSAPLLRRGNVSAAATNADRLGGIRYATGATGLTVTPPVGTVGPLVAVAVAVWAAVS